MKLLIFSELSVVKLCIDEWNRKVLNFNSRTLNWEKVSLHNEDEQRFMYQPKIKIVKIYCDLST